MDDKKISKEQHELNYILQKFTKRQTKENRRILKNGIRKYKKDQRYNKHTKEKFYDYFKKNIEKDLDRGIKLEMIRVIGPAKAEKLRAKGIKDIKTFLKTDNTKLKRILGEVDITKMKKDAKEIL